MLRFWHVCLLVLIALIWKVRPSSTTVDVCSMEGSSGLFCKCEKGDQVVSCYILQQNFSSDTVWLSFSRARNLQSLKLQCTRKDILKSLSQLKLKGLKHLETLTVFDGNLGDIEKDAISGLSTLTSLNLNRNDITSLHRFALTDLPNLLELKLEDNQLTELLADAFVGMGKLEKLFLSQNNISRIENCAFCNLHNLRELDLSQNNLLDVTEYVFRGLGYVTRLDLNRNQLRVLNEKVFTAMPSLDELNLESNLLTYISPRAFNGLKELRTLKLGRNQLKTLPDRIFQPLASLLVLSLSNNQLETVQREVVDSIHNIFSENFMFTFATNPLICSCDLSWIPKFLIKVRSLFFEKELKRIECENENKTIVPAVELALENCKEKENAMLHEPALSTLEEDTQSNPKYETDFSYDDDDVDDEDIISTYEFSKKIADGLVKQLKEETTTEKTNFAKAAGSVNNFLLLFVIVLMFFHG